MSQPELLKSVVMALDSAGASYMVTGSFASSLQGEPRLTHDIDLVVMLHLSAVKSLLRSFPAPDYYMDEQAIIDAMANKSQFNLLHITSGNKVDFWILTDDPFDQSRFGRRRAVPFRGMQIYFSSPEDTILMKLRWAEMSGGSEKQFGDAKSVYELQRGKLDVSYIQRWVQSLNVSALWERLKAEAVES